MSEKFETIAIRTQTERSANKEHSSPIYLTSSYKFDDAEEMRALFANEKQGNVYSRYSNPNTSEFIEKMCLLEGAEDGFATATGMAAIFTYGFPISEEKISEAKLEVYTLSNYKNLIEFYLN